MSFKRCTTAEFQAHVRREPSCQVSTRRAHNANLNRIYRSQIDNVTFQRAKSADLPKSARRKKSVQQRKREKIARDVALEQEARERELRESNAREVQERKIQERKDWERKVRERETFEREMYARKSRERERQQEEEQEKEARDRETSEKENREQEERGRETQGTQNDEYERGRLYAIKILQRVINGKGIMTTDGIQGPSQRTKKTKFGCWLPPKIPGILRPAPPEFTPYYRLVGTLPDGSRMKRQQNLERLAILADKSPEEVGLAMSGYHWARRCHQPGCFNPAHLCVEGRETKRSRTLCSGRAEICGGKRVKGEKWKRIRGCRHIPYCICTEKPDPALWASFERIPKKESEDWKNSGESQCDMEMSGSEDCERPGSNTDMKGSFDELEVAGYEEEFEGFDTEMCTQDPPIADVLLRRMNPSREKRLYYSVESRGEESDEPDSDTETRMVSEVCHCEAAGSPCEQRHLPRKNEEFLREGKPRAAEESDPGSEFWKIVNDLTGEILDSEIEGCSDDEMKTTKNNSDALVWNPDVEEDVEHFEFDTPELAGDVELESHESDSDDLILTPTPRNVDGQGERFNVFSEDFEVEGPDGDALGWFNQFCDNIIRRDYGMAHQGHIPTGKRLAVIL